MCDRLENLCYISLQSADMSWVQVVAVMLWVDYGADQRRMDDPQDVQELQQTPAKYRQWKGPMQAEDIQAHDGVRLESGFGC